MADYIIGTESFRKNLDDWLFKDDQLNANFLFVNRNKIPSVFRSYKQKLYRGMYIDDQELEKMEKTGSMILDRHTSWSKNETIATKFVSDESFSLGRTTIQKKKILIGKVIQTSGQILDIDAFVSFMGIKQMMMLGYDETNLDSASKEKEVLISKGVRILKTDIKILK